METYRLTNDIRLLCVTARSFPYGLAAAFATLEQRLPALQKRACFGISYLNAEGIRVYKAAVTELQKNEAERYGCETFVIPHGDYLTQTVAHWPTFHNSVNNAFECLYAAPQLDRDFPRVEWYSNCEEVTCMVRINPAKNGIVSHPEPNACTQTFKTNELC